MKKIFQKKRNNKIFIVHRCKKQYQLILAPQKNTNPQKNRADPHLKVSSERINYEKSTLV